MANIRNQVAPLKLENVSSKPEIVKPVEMLRQIKHANRIAVHLMLLPNTEQIVSP